MNDFLTWFAVFSMVVIICVALLAIFANWRVGIRKGTSEHFDIGFGGAKRYKLTGIDFDSRATDRYGPQVLVTYFDGVTGHRLHMTFEYAMEIGFVNPDALVKMVDVNGKMRFPYEED